MIFCAVWLYGLEARTLIPSDEGRYAEMAREMASTNDFITPRLNGIKYFEKPPLQTWINALTFKAFGLGRMASPSMDRTVRIVRDRDGRLYRTTDF